MAVICPYCDTENAENAEICKQCNQRIDQEIDFEEPVKRLTEISSKIMKKEIPHTRENLEGIYQQVMDSVQLILDQSMLKLQDNLEDLRELQEEAKEGLDEEDYKSFQRFLDEFENAQDKINTGLEYARDTFFSAQTFEDLEKGHIDLSSSAAAIQEGLSSIEQLTEETQRHELMRPRKLHISPEIETAVTNLDSILMYLNDYIESGETSYIMNSLDQLAVVRKSLEKTLEESMKEAVMVTLPIGKEEEAPPEEEPAEEPMAGVAKEEYYEIGGPEEEYGEYYGEEIEEEYYEEGEEYYPEEVEYMEGEKAPAGAPVEYNDKEEPVQRYHGSEYI